MTSTADIRVEGTGAAPATATNRTNLVTLALAFWFTAGLFLDAWAHNNVPELETFFTPWHAVFYSGFAATAAWILWTCRSALRAQPWHSAIPAGYAPSLISLGVFALAGVGDLTWHQVFGIEQRIDILFSPTHLALGGSMLVIVTTPLRSAWADRSIPAAPGLRRLSPAVGSLALATTIVLLFLQYANAYANSSVDVVVGLSDGNEDWTGYLVSKVAVTNLVLLIPLLAVARRFTLPAGAATIVYVPVAVLAGVVRGFDNVDVLIGLGVAGVIVDLLILWLRPGPDRRLQFRSFAALAPLVPWTAYVIVAAFTPRPQFLGPDGNALPTNALFELYTGVPIVQTLLGLLIGIIMTLDRAER